MTALNQTVQHGVIPTRYGQFAAGQKASATPCKVKSARYDDQSTGTNTHALPFGYACGLHGADSRSSTGSGGDGGLIVSQDIVRDTVFTLGANLSSSATSIAWDADGNSTDIDGRNAINAGDFLVIGGEAMYVAGVGATALSVVRGQKGTTAASHNSGAAAYNMSGRSNFAGVVLRDLTVPGRFNTSEVDAFIDGEIVPILYDGDIVCVFGGAVGQDDIGKPVSAVASGTGLGQFTVGEGATNILVPNSQILTTSETVGSVYLAAVRFTG